MDLVQFSCEEWLDGRDPPPGEPTTVAAHVGLTVPEHATEDDVAKLMARVHERALATLRYQRKVNRERES